MKMRSKGEVKQKRMRKEKEKKHKKKEMRERNATNSFLKMFHLPISRARETDITTSCLAFFTSYPNFDP